MRSIKNYVRVVTRNNGESAFEDAQIPLAPEVVAQAVPTFMTGIMSSRPGAQYLLCPEFNSAPHTAPREQWIVMLRGSIDIEVTDGSTRSFGAGDLVLVTDTTGKGHRTRAVGEPVEALFIPVAPAV